ncbi:MAG: NYN domain-containing protein [Erysipelotrichaceae bacterium]|nr:NYN domain-containing protein [Erysipelotrichaceae bacterium]
MEDINIALLIDADNVAPKYIQEILSELSKYGKITVRRMYGDWSSDRLHSWLKTAGNYSITPVMQTNNTPGKNASDICLIIDAMDILYTGDVQGFCIVSSDGDFNRLATRIREAGMTVIGMGEKKTPESFRNSCERFVFLDVIDSDETEAPKKKKTRSRKEKETSEPEGNAEGESLFTDKDDIESAIIKIVTDNSVEGKETGLGEIGSRLVKIYPDFDIRNYHYSKLSEFLKDFPSLNVIYHDNAAWVALQSSPTSEIEKQIKRVFSRHREKEIDISALQSELKELNPNLSASIRKSGVTRFSVYLDRVIPSVEVVGNKVRLKEEIVTRS